MKRIESASWVAALLLVAIGAGCSRAESLPAPVFPSAAREDGFAGSWMKPEAKNADLLYVADLNRNAVLVFTYPAGLHVGTIKGMARPHGECVDAAGDVWVTNGIAQNIVEFAHGGTTPIATLPDPNAFPAGCAVNQTTGDLAVMNFPPGSGNGDVVVYAGAKGSPRQLPASFPIVPYKGAYDDKGNLWIEGTPSDGAGVIFGEYLAIKHRWRSILLKHAIVHPGGLQWLKNELVVGDQGPIDGPSTVYEFSMNGIVGKLAGTTPLTNSCNMLEFVVVAKTVVAGNTCQKTVRYFAFPQGGMSRKTIKSGLSQPSGVALSRAR